MHLACHDVGFSYGRDTRALDSVSLELAPGVTGLMGVNGAGKSTLLGTLCGALAPSTGRVELDGVDLSAARRAPALRRIGLMPQELRVPRRLACRDVVAYLGWLRGLSAADARRRAPDALRSVGLGDQIDHRVHTLSGGMQRRLALAQALISSPDVLLLDEPTTGLDPEQRAAVRGLIASRSSQGIVVLSSHIVEDIVGLADRLVVLHDGEVRYHGPTSRFVEEYGGPEGSAEHAFLAVTARPSAA